MHMVVAAQKAGALSFVRFKSFCCMGKTSFAEAGCTWDQWEANEF